MPVDRRWVSSVDGGEQVSVDGTSALVNGDWRESGDEQALLSIDEERASLWIEPFKLAGSGENASLYVASGTAGNVPENPIKKFMSET